MKRIGLIAATLIALPAATQAANCTVQWNAINDLLIRTGAVEAALPGIVRQGADGSCRIDGIDLPIDRHIRIETDQILWNGTDMDRFVNEGLPPTALTLRARGIRIIPDFGDKALAYLNRIQNQGRTIDLLFDVDWDETAKILTLNALNLSFPDDDYVRLSAEIESVDLSSRTAIQMSAGSMVITRSITEIRSTRLFQDYLLQPLGLALLFQSDDPEARVAELKEIAGARLATVPTDILPQSSRDALLDLVDQMPDPSGMLRIEKNATPGIGPARFATLAMRRGGITDPDQIWDALHGLVLNITFTPE